MCQVPLNQVVPCKSYHSELSRVAAVDALALTIVKLALTNATELVRLGDARQRPLTVRPNAKKITKQLRRRYNQQFGAYSASGGKAHVGIDVGDQRSSVASLSGAWRAATIVRGNVRRWYRRSSSSSSFVGFVNRATTRADLVALNNYSLPRDGRQALRVSDRRRQPAGLTHTHPPPRRTARRRQLALSRRQLSGRRPLRCVALCFKLVSLFCASLTVVQGWSVFALAHVVASPWLLAPLLVVAGVGLLLFRCVFE